MIGCYTRKPAISDALNPTFDVGQESGIGSDSDSIIGVDPSLTMHQRTPSSSHPSSSDDTALSLDSHMSTTSGHVTSSSAELLSSSADGVADWRHVAERYTSNVPQHVIDNVRLDEEYARLVLPPPPTGVDNKPEMDPTPEVESQQSPVETQHSRRLPAVPAHGALEAKASETQADRMTVLRPEDNSAELWRRAADQNVPHHQRHRHAPAHAIQQTQTHTLPRSRAHHQPVSDVVHANTVFRDISQQKRVAVVNPRQIDANPDDYVRSRDVPCDWNEATDRKSVDVENRKWKNQVTFMTSHLSDMSRQPVDDVINSDRKHLRYATRDDGHHEQRGPARSSEGGLKLLERRQAAGREGSVTQQQNLKLMVQQLNSKQRQLEMSPEPPGRVDKRHQDVSPLWTPERTHRHILPEQQHHHVSAPWTPPKPQHVSLVDPAAVSRRQLDFEAGLRRYGPNYRPQQSTTQHHQNSHIVSAAGNVGNQSISHFIVR